MIAQRNQVRLVTSASGTKPQFHSLRRCGSPFTPRYQSTKKRSAKNQKKRKCLWTNASGRAVFTVACSAWRPKSRDSRAGFCSGTRGGGRAAKGPCSWLKSASRRQKAQPRYALLQFKTKSSISHVVQRQPPLARAPRSTLIKRPCSFKSCGKGSRPRRKPIECEMKS